ncbi:hypothetical protein ACF0H5_002493 [Mactra antiquata]
MSGSTGATDEVRISSRDLEILLQSGNLNFDGLAGLQVDPSVTQQLMQFKNSQSHGGDSNVNAASGSSSNVRYKPRSNPNTVRQSSRGTIAQGPYVEITEQPKARGLRFRYECEGRSAGSIPGETSTPERKTFPSIKIHNYSGPAVIVVSCVTKEEPYKPHPHNLVGKDCKKGVCTLRIRDTTTVSFPHLGIQCAKKKDVEGNLKTRQDINVDPFQTGFKHKGQNIDLNVVRLCFQVFLPDEQGKITRIVPPVVSQAIHDKKALNDLVICRVDRTSGKPKGGDEVFLLCEKINRDDIRVRFYEERDGQLLWEGFGDFGQNDVHRQFAIVFKTPPYRDQYLQQPVEVSMQIQRSSDAEGSEPIMFTYQPEDPDPDRILEKRKRKAANLSYLQDPSGNSNISPETLKHRLKLKATRTGSRAKNETVTVKEEVKSPDVPQYSFANIGSQQPSASLSMAAMSLAQPMDMGTATIASSNGMSGGKIQYTQPTQSQLPSVALTPQILQLLASSGILTAQQQNQPNPLLLQQQQQQQMGNQDQVQQPPVSQPFQHDPGSQQQQQQTQVNAQAELLKSLMLQLQQGQTGISQATSGPLLSGNDPNMQGQNQEMNSLGSLSFDQNLLNSIMQGESPMISLESVEGLGGIITDLTFDQNVAQFETVGGDQSSQQPYDETSAAVQNLNG